MAELLLDVIDLSLDIAGMQDMMCLLAAWHAKVLIVQLLDGRVVMGLPVGHGSVQIIQGFRTGCFHIHSSAHIRRLDRLAAAVYAAAGASHDLNELIVCLAVFHTVKQRLGVNKVRGIELSLLQRCAAHCASKTDIDEAYLAGRAAVDAAVSGVTDKMVSFKCSRDRGYHCEIALEPLDVVANFEKKVPREWINEAGNGVNQAFIDYALPLIQGDANPPQEFSLPRFAKLKKILAE